MTVEWNRTQNEIAWGEITEFYQNQEIYNQLEGRKESEENQKINYTRLSSPIVNKRKKGKELELETIV